MCIHDVDAARFVFHYVVYLCDVCLASVLRRWEGIPNTISHLEMRDERPIGLSRVYFSHQTDLVIFFSPRPNFKKTLCARN